MYTHTGTHALKYVLIVTEKHKISSKKTEERNVVVNSKCSREGKKRRVERVFRETTVCCQPATQVTCACHTGATVTHGYLKPQTQQDSCHVVRLGMQLIYYTVPQNADPDTQVCCSGEISPPSSGWPEGR